MERNRAGEALHGAIAATRIRRQRVAARNQVQWNLRDGPKYTGASLQLLRGGRFRHAKSLDSLFVPDPNRDLEFVWLAQPVVIDLRQHGQLVSGWKTPPRRGRARQDAVQELVGPDRRRLKRRRRRDENAAHREIARAEIGHFKDVPHASLLRPSGRSPDAQLVLPGLQREPRQPPVAARGERAERFTGQADV